MADMNTVRERMAHAKKQAERCREVIAYHEAQARIKKQELLDHETSVAHCKAALKRARSTLQLV